MQYRTDVFMLLLEGSNRMRRMRRWLYVSKSVKKHRLVGGLMRALAAGQTS